MEAVSQTEKASKGKKKRPVTRVMSAVVPLSIPPEVLAREAKERDERETLDKLVRPDARITRNATAIEKLSGTEAAPATPVPSAPPAPALSERADSISLLSEDDESEAEKRLQTQRDITQTWQRIEKLMYDETANVWALGDEFNALTEKEVGGTRISIREIADKVRRGKSYVDSLMSTATAFPKDKRLGGYTWFSHDLHRRGFKRVIERLDKAGIARPKGVAGFLEMCLKGINKAKARTTEDAFAAILSVMKSEKIVDAEQAATLGAKPEAKQELQLFLTRTTRGLACIEIHDKPQPGKDTYSGWHFQKLAWKKWTNLDAELAGRRALIVPLLDGRPQIAPKTAQLLLDCAAGDETALAEFAAKTESRWSQKQQSESQEEGNNL